MDLIDRQAAIDEITEYGSGDAIYMSVVELKRRIEQLPSAQPEVAKDINVPTNDCISRQAAIRIASGYCHPANVAKELAKLPSAQPEIIRCKDCMYYKDLSCTNDYWYTECLTGDLIGIDVQPWEQFYCYFAERREE